MDQLVKNILVLVASIPGENPGRRKGKGFLATLSQNPSFFANFIFSAILLCEPYLKIILVFTGEILKIIIRSSIYF